MKVFSVIPYWIDTQTGETRSRKIWLYLKIGRSYDEVYKWAQNNKERLNFSFQDVFDMKDIQESSLRFDVSVREEKDIILTDIDDNEYRVEIKPVSKIQIQRIEIPLEE